jgi:hypothetical protein
VESKRVHMRLAHRLHVVQPTVGTSATWVYQCGVVRFSSSESLTDAKLSRLKRIPQGQPVLAMQDPVDIDGFSDVFEALVA